MLRNSGGVHEVIWDKCAHGSVFEYVTVEGQGHAWPGGPSPRQSSVFGNATDHLDATSAIWAFFKAHARQ
jgi:polyhydroxybutyrate depolymerase